MNKMFVRAGFVFAALFGSFVAFSQTAIEAAVRQYSARPDDPVGRGKPMLFINDVPEYPMFYSLTDVPGGRWSWEEVPRYNLKSFCEIGIKLIQVDIAFDHIWKEDGTIVMDTVQKQIKGILDVCPQAAIFIRFHVNPPKWWQKKFPEENTIYADTQPMPDIDWGIQRIIEDDEENPTRHSLASRKWIDESTQKLVEFLQKLNGLPEGKALAGIQVAGGVYGEWHYWGFIENEPDMSIHMQQYFRRWLSKKYKTNQSLQKAWGNNAVTIETAEVPTLAQRRQTREGVFRDPTVERNVIDYYEAQHDVIVDDILHFCEVVKKNWPRPIVTGAFYGYFYAVFGREAAGGHLQLQRLLSSPYIDYLSGPGTYYPNAVEMGESYRSRSLINSVTLHGKLWLDEMDQQPPLVPLKDPGYQQSLQKSIGQVRRNVLFTFSNGQGLWFYDFGSAGFNGGPRLKDHGTWGWWDEPTLRRDIQGLKTELEKHFKKTPTHSADVLLVHDTKSFYYIGSSREHSGIAHRANNWLPVGIFKSGVVHDVIHFEDLDKVDLDRYKAIVFVNTFVMNSDQRRLISKVVAKNNRHLIWVYAPAYCDETKLSTEFIQEVTGMKLTKVATNDPVSIRLDSAIANTGPINLGKNTITTPLFVVNHGDAIPLGWLNNTSVGLASKKLAHSTSWFMTLPIDNPDLWRYIFRKAGAHLFTEDQAIIYSGHGTITVHTKDGGPIVLRLRNGKSVSYVMPPSATWLIDDETGDVIFK
jgi:hypothetical protein